MAVITISRQVGSGGVSIGKTAAEILGYHLIDKNTLADVLKEYGIVEFEKVYDFSEGFWDRFAPSRSRMVMMMNQSIQAIATHDNAVILGRGSYVVLGGFANVLNVRIQPQTVICWPTGRFSRTLLKGMRWTMETSRISGRMCRIPLSGY